MANDNEAGGELEIFPFDFGRERLLVDAIGYDYAGRDGHHAFCRLYVHAAVPEVVLADWKEASNRLATAPLLIDLVEVVFYRLYGGSVAS